MSQTIIAVVVQLLAIALPKLGITVGSEELTNAVSTILVILSGIWIWYRRTKVGDVNAIGVKKS